MAGYQLKDFPSIVAAMINHARATQGKITDFEVGAVARTIMESSAIEIEEAYQRTFFGILDGIQTSVYQTFGFGEQAASAATGKVIVRFGGPIVEPFTVPQGTVFLATASGLKFVAIADVTVPEGVLAVDIAVSCATPGAVGNIAANAITSAVSYSLPAGATVSSTAMAGGSDGLSESERKARFVEFIQSLSRGPIASIVYAVRQVQITNSAGVLLEYVTRVGHAEFPGEVRIYLYGSAGRPSAAMLAKAQQVVDGSLDKETGQYQIGYVAAGVGARVLPMIERPVPVYLKVKMLPGVAGTDSTKVQIAELVRTVIDGVPSEGILYVEQITNAALNAAGVEGALAESNANVLCGANEVLTLGAFNVDWIGDDD